MIFNNRADILILILIVYVRFLESLTPPVKVDEMKVQRWHPKFKLEELPEVTIAALPEAPEVCASSSLLAGSD